MITITFIDHQGQATEVQAEPGASLMQVATEHGIDGIVAECGGACSCATCLCHVDAAWAGRVGPASGMEHAMVEASLAERPHSRLACQVKLTPELHGLVVHLPASQY